MQEPRDYRENSAIDLEQHNLVVGETDLAISLLPGVWNDELAKGLRDLIIAKRRDLQSFIMEYSDFASSHQPITLPPLAPKVIKELVEASSKASVGPMAAVAGYFAELVGEYILHETNTGEIIVENGGDIYLASNRDRCIGIFAGKKSPFTGVIAIKLQADQTPCGICTSSGTIGSSFSYGVADAAIIISPNTALADATATAAANLVKGPEDVGDACDFAMSVAGVEAALIVCEEQMAAAGNMELVQI